MNFKATKKSFGWLSKIAVVGAAAILLPMASGVSEPLDAQDTRVAKATPAGESTPYPQIVKTIPKVGATEVRTSMKAIRVTFDRDMNKGMSWTGGPPLFPPTDPNQKPRWIDDRSIVFAGRHSSGYQSLWKLDLESGEAIRLTRSPLGTRDYLALSGQRDKIVFSASSVDRQWRLWQVGIDGSDLRQITRGGEHSGHLSPVWIE